jgi:GntR family transcriptional repressor for pyruvate dehydrogenase complex
MTADGPDLDPRGPAHPRVARIRPQRAAALVAADIRARILTGDVEGGLPTETVLLEEFAVSRPTLREALRILETEGLIRTRRGKNGGAVVKRPTAASAAYHLGLALQAALVDITDLAAVRELLEPLCVSLAAQRPDRVEVAARLDAISDEAETLVGRGAEFTASALRFHAALIEACDNLTLRILVGTIEIVWQSQERAWAEGATAHGDYPEPAEQQHTLRSHRRIARRIANGDIEGAMRASGEHLSAAMRFVCGSATGSIPRFNGETARRPVDARTLRA